MAGEHILHLAVELCDRDVSCVLPFGLYKVDMTVPESVCQDFTPAIDSGQISGDADLVLCPYGGDLSIPDDNHPIFNWSRFRGGIDLRANEGIVSGLCGNPRRVCGGGCLCKEKGSPMDQAHRDEGMADDREVPEGGGWVRTG